MADIKNFGIKGLSADVQLGKSGGRLKYDSDNNRFDFTQSNGSTLEDVRFGSVTAGTWAGSVIGTEYGGLGSDFSGASGIVTLSGGTASVGNIDLSDSNLFSGELSVAQGGTGAGTASDARSNLGLGSLAIQDDDNVSISGGSLDGVIIGGSDPAAITGTTITADSGFSGALTGNVTGDVTGNVTGTAGSLENAQDFSASGDATAPAVSFDGTGAVDLVLTLANTTVAAGSYGSATEVPVFTVDSKGRITEANTVSITTSFDIAGDVGSNDTVAGGETLSIVGTSGQLETTITNNQVEVGIVDIAVQAELHRTGCIVGHGQG